MSYVAFFGLWGAILQSLRRYAHISLAERLFYSGLILFFEIVSLTQLAGLCHVLTPITIRIGAALLLTIHSYQAFRSPIDKSLKNPATEIAAIWPKPFWLCLIILATVISWRIFLAIKLPPYWDGLSYHLPLILHWIREQSLDFAGNGVGLTAHFPHNGELIGAWLCLISNSHVDSAKIAQAVSLPLLVVSAYLLGKELVGPRWAVALGLALLSVPVIIIQAGEAYVDVFYATFWIAALTGFTLYWKKAKFINFLSGSVAMGLALGAKASAYFLLPLCIAALAVVLADNNNRPSLAMMCIGGGLALWIGGGAFVNNWINWGNPVYPFQVKIGPFTLFHGTPSANLNISDIRFWFVQKTLNWWWYPLRETYQDKIAYTNENGFGALFTVGWFALPLTIYKAWRERSMPMLLWISLFLLTLFLFFAVHPVQEPRYVIFLSIFPAIGLAFLLRDLTGYLEQVAFVFWAIAICFNALGTVRSVLLNPGVHTAWQQLKQTGSYDLGDYYKERYGALGQGWTAINSVLTDKDVVATNASDLVLPWAGTPARATLDVVFPSTPEDSSYYGAETPQPWLNLLFHLKANYLALCNIKWVGDSTADEEATIAAHPQLFHLMGTWQDEDFGRVQLFKIAADPSK